MKKYYPLIQKKAFGRHIAYVVKRLGFVSSQYPRVLEGV